MAIEDQVGLTGPDYEVDIERGKVREFARAMGAPLPEFIEGRVIPATFLVSAPYSWGYTLERPRGTVFSTIDHDLTVSLHAEEALIFHGQPPAAGDRLVARAKLEDVTRKSGRSGGDLTFLTMLTEYCDLNGDLRVEQRSVSVTTDTAPGDGNWPADIPVYEPEYPALERESPFSSIARAGLDDLSVDFGPGSIAAGPLMKQDIVRFQGVVGEDDPLHHDREWALKQGYPEVFALGTHQASQMAAYAAYWTDPLAVRGYRVRFRSIVWPGDRLVFDGKVDRRDHIAKTARLYLTCARQSGVTVAEAWMDLDFSDLS